jgi:hypothetical protein
MDNSIPINELETLLEQIISEIGESWAAQNGPARGRRELPLATWIRITKEASPTAWPKMQESLRLARLAMDLNALRTASVEGLEERVALLKATNEEKFYSTVQELGTASRYVNSGHQVEFLAEAEDRRADLLINGEAEVECKLKVRETQLDRQRYDLYDLLHRRIQRAMDQPDAATEISVEATFRTEPTRAGVDQILALVDLAVRPDGPFAFADTNNDPSYRIRATRSSTRNCRGLHLPLDSPNRYDVREVIGKTAVDDAGNMTMGSVSMLAVRCEVLQDRVKSLEKSLKSARGQFSKTRPSIIHVDITNTLPDLAGDKLPRSQEVLRSFLRNNRSVSVVVLEHDHFVNSEDNLTLSRVVEPIPNENAHYPVHSSLHEVLVQRGVSSLMVRGVTMWHAGDASGAA